MGCLLVRNERHLEGMHTSIGAGVRALGADVGATVVMLADMPFVTSAMLQALVREWRDGARLVVSRYGGDVEAPPMLYDRELFGELAVMQRRCGKEVIRRHRDEARILDWPAAALRDVDTPEDHALLGAELEAVRSAT